MTKSKLFLGQRHNGRFEDRTVSNLDLFPTLAEAAGIPPPKPCPKNLEKAKKTFACTCGKSLLKMMQKRYHHTIAI